MDEHKTFLKIFGAAWILGFLVTIAFWVVVIWGFVAAIQFLQRL